jgi:hypothetical protein
MCRMPVLDRRKFPQISLRYLTFFHPKIGGANAPMIPTKVCLDYLLLRLRLYA